MIDIHCHILPGMDDGAKHMEESVEMAKAALTQGIDTIIATPHHNNNKYFNTKTTIIKAVEDLNERLVKENLPITVLPGQETRIYGDMVQGVKKGDLLTLNQTSPYIFVELPTNHVPRYTEQLLFDLQMEDLTPIIVHPERNTELLEQPSELYELVRNGALTQLTAASLVGKFGKKIKKFSHDLIEARLTHFIASDAHNTRSRGFVMAEAIEEIKNQYGQQMLYTFMENPQLLINGEALYIDEPHRIKTKKFLGLF